MSATRRGPAGSPIRSRGVSGSASRIASSRSPLPRPCSALTGMRLAEAERPERAVRPVPRASSTLLAASDDRLARPAQHRGDGLVGVGHARRWRPATNSTASAASTATRACAATRAASSRRLAFLGPDGSQPPVSTQRERAAAPGGVVGDPVPGDPGGVRDHRLPAAEDAVHQRGLADVGPADHRHDRARALRAVRPSPGRRRWLSSPRRSGVSSPPPSGRAPGHSCPPHRPARGPGPTISRMTSSRPRAVVSISTASAALAICGASDRSRRACSARVTATVTAGSAARSAVRRVRPDRSRWRSGTPSPARRAPPPSRCPGPRRRSRRPPAQVSAMMPAASRPGGGGPPGPRRPR